MGIINNNKKDVSILTISQYKRFTCLKILFTMIQRQTYLHYVKEWIIVEGTQIKEEAAKNKININNFIDEIKEGIDFKIKYIEYSGVKLGQLRNIGNDTCSGKYIVCLDDDDYYPRKRIESAVETLNNSKCLIGGVSDVYLYDFFLDRLYKFKGFMEFHSTNNCMAYKKEFLLSNRHDPQIEVGEERSFTKEFTIPLVKINSRDTIIAISHNFNTFNKRELCLGGTLKTLHTLEEIQEPITNYIDEDIFLRMKELYVIEKKSKYDIAYMIGAFTNKFDPKSNLLYDNERAIVKLTEYWSKKKKKIAVYGEFENNFTYKNIDYIHWKQFPFQHIFNILILFRTNGVLSTIPFPVRANHIYWDVYDNFIHNDKLIEIYKLYGHKINKIYLKSEFHKSEFHKYLQLFPEQKIEIIPSGIRNEFYFNNENVERNPYRFCYTTYYDRGLEFIITGIFSIIKKIEPRAELHIYTGMENIADEPFKNKMLNLFSETGVCEHGAQSSEIIAREKQMSTFELYVSNIINEVDCVSIRESVIAGCIPLVSNFGLFLEREGFKFDMNHEDPKVMQRVALLILNLMKDKSKIDYARNDFTKICKTKLSWEQVATLMYNTFDL